MICSLSVVFFEEKVQEVMAEELKSHCLAKYHRKNKQKGDAKEQNNINEVSRK